MDESNFTKETLLTIRARVLDGDDITTEEMTQVVAFLRADRIPEAKEKAKPKSKKLTKDEVADVIEVLFK